MTDTRKTYSTLKNISNEAPKFPLGKVAGQYCRFPLGTGDIDGGLRLQGKYKKDTDDKPLITYITVVYNRVNTLLRCMESIWSQDYDNIEYIVVDGGSTDGTVDLIKSHEDYIDYFISQKDSGIYNAMNKGISLASGRFICFMNSDDICTPIAGKTIAQHYLNDKADLINGRINLRDKSGNISPAKFRTKILIRDNVIRYEGIYHQALYSSAEVFNKVGLFDETYSSAADLKWVNDCKNWGYKISLIDEILAVFSLGGLSDENRENSVRETCLIFLERYPVLNETVMHQMYYCYKRCPFLTREITPIIKKIMPYLKNNIALRKCIYEISLFMIIEELEMNEKKFEKIEFEKLAWYKKRIHKISKYIHGCCDVSNIEQVKNILEDKLKASVNDDLGENIKVKDLYLVGKIKRIINSLERKRVYEYIYIKKYSPIVAKWNYVILCLKEVGFNSLKRTVEKIETDYIGK